MAWSISCDGPPPIHNRFRVFHSGKDSSAAVERAIRLSVKRTRKKFGGVLCVVDPRADPRAIVRYFAAVAGRADPYADTSSSEAARPRPRPACPYRR